MMTREKMKKMEGEARAWYAEGNDASPYSVAVFAINQVKAAVSEREREIVRKLRERAKWWQDQDSGAWGMCHGQIADELTEQADEIEHGEVKEG